MGIERTMRQSPNRPHAFIPDRNRPVDAQARNPLDSTSLYRESEGRIEPLVQTIIENSSGNPGVIAAGLAGGFSLAIGERRTIQKRGSGIVWIGYSVADFNTYFRLLKNQQIVLPWLSITRQIPANFGIPVSPFAGPSTTFTVAQPTFIGFQNPFIVDFDQVDVFNNTGTLVQLQALVTSGTARIA